VLRRVRTTNINPIATHVPTLKGLNRPHDAVMYALSNPFRVQKVEVVGFPACYAGLRTTNINPIVAHVSTLKGLNRAHGHSWGSDWVDGRIEPLQGSKGIGLAVSRRVTPG
jgi:hypothetical protein